MTTVSIIGTAGRGKDGDKMSLVLYQNMCRKALELLPADEDIHLVSGGAAWADHVAVSLWNGRYSITVNNSGKSIIALTLYLPAPILPSGYDEGGDGRVAQYYHSHFRQKVNCNTVQSILKAQSNGAVLEVVPGGFKARNNFVAQSDHIIAFTWGEELSRPKDGGTLDTWNKAQHTAKSRIHVPLSTLTESI